MENLNKEEQAKAFEALVDELTKYFDSIEPKVCDCDCDKCSGNCDCDKKIEQIDMELLDKSIEKLTEKYPEILYCMLEERFLSDEPMPSEEKINTAMGLLEKKEFEYKNERANLLEENEILKIDAEDFSSKISSEIDELQKLKLKITREIEDLEIKIDDNWETSDAQRTENDRLIRLMDYKLQNVYTLNDFYEQCLDK